MTFGGHTPSIDAALASHRRKIRSELEYQRRIAERYRDAFNGVLREQRKFATYVEVQKAKGAPVSPSWAFRQERYLALESQMIAAIKKFQGEYSDLLGQMYVDAAKSGVDGVSAEVARMTGLTPERARTVNGFDADTWSRIDTSAFEHAIALSTQNRSPLTQLIDGMGLDAHRDWRREWTTGLAAGHNPNRIASRLANSIKGLTQGRAQTIARTEWHRATRAARQEAFEQSDVVQSWIWRSALDGRTCGVCYINHGTEHKTNEMLPGHPNCRCVMIPKTKDWAALGVSGIRATQAPIEPGASKFRRLSEKEQKRLIGQRRLDMYKAGTPLRSMLETVRHPQWGPMAKFKNLPPKGFPNPKPPAKPDMQTSQMSASGGIHGIQTHAGYGSPKTLGEWFDAHRPKIDGSSKLLHPTVEAYYQKVASLLGMPTAEAMARAKANLQATVDQGVLASRRSMRSLDSILREGRFKTQFETGNSAGAFSPGFRAEAEEKMFGYHRTNLPVEKRPVYGYLETTGPKPAYSGESSYGEVKFVMKEEVRDRATVVWEDSLGSAAKPSPVKSVEPYSFEGRAYASNASERLPAVGEAGVPYTEVQYHGGLSIDDVASIHFTRSLPGTETVKLLGGRGFKPTDPTNPVDWTR